MHYRSKFSLLSARRCIYFNKKEKKEEKNIELHKNSVISDLLTPVGS